jgi:hypothetical protein
MVGFILFGPGALLVYAMVTCDLAQPTAGVCAGLAAYPAHFQWLMIETLAGKALLAALFAGFVLFHLYAYYAALRNIWRWADGVSDSDA